MHFSFKETKIVKLGVGLNKNVDCDEDLLNWEFNLSGLSRTVLP